jgi:hypothetical protein
MDEGTIATIDALVRWAGPVALVLLVIYLLRSKTAPARIEQLLKPFGSVKFFGQELVLRHSEQVSRGAEEAFTGYRRETKAKYEELVAKYKVAELHQRLDKEYLLPAIGDSVKSEDYRSTIHVRNFLFADTYLQLVPYLPAGGRPAGRSWSIRYGIVGRTWRHEESTGEGDLQTSTQDLIDGWGMTKEEADKARASKPALLAVVLKDSGGKPVGIYYADSQTKNAFGENQDQWLAVARKIEDGARKIDLTLALSNIANELPKGPIIPRLEDPD